MFHVLKQVDVIFAKNEKLRGEVKNNYYIRGLNEKI